MPELYDTSSSTGFVAPVGNGEVLVGFHFEGVPRVNSFCGAANDDAAR